MTSLPLDRENALARISELRKEIDGHNYRYYILSAPVISDYDFDQLLEELARLENAFPESFDPNSPTQRVGGGLTKEFRQVRHQYPMLSLSNTYSTEELMDFDNRVKKTLGISVDYVCELKYDGVAIGLTYENGMLVQAVTRGDGIFGDDVINNVRTIPSIPLRLYDNAVPSRFEIRGEIFMPRRVFNKLNDERRSEGLEPFANPRNAASGSLKMQDPAEVARRKLDCFLYYILGDALPFQDHYNNLMVARNWGFNVPPYLAKCRDMEEVLQFLREWETDKSGLPFDIDGVVVKVNNYEQQNRLGYTAKVPRWAVAYKFSPERVRTRLLSITFQVGRTGAVTPVANMEPVLLAGTMVKRATLHNQDIIRNLDVRVGDHVFVEKGGEIIPKIVGVDLSTRPQDSVPVDFPATCPECGTLLIKNPEEAQHYCPNYEACPPQIKGKLEHAISRKALDINSLGEGKIEILFDYGLVKDLADLYFLSYSDLFGLEKIYTDPEGNEKKISFREKSVVNILEGIKKSREVPFERVLFALGIRYVGETVAKKLARHFPNLEALMEASVEELREVPEVGDRIAESVSMYFHEKRNLDLLNRLKTAGLQFSIDKNAAELSEDRLKGASFVVSGTFTGFSREALKETIEKYGGKNTSSISSRTDFLLAGDDMGPSKLKKATELGIRIINEEEFLAMIQ